MNQCPICQLPAKDVDRACQCGELFQPWRTIEFYGDTLRQRGLTLAQSGEYLKACLSFVQAALTNPLDDKSTLDAARSLARLGCCDEAVRLIKAAGHRLPTEETEALSAAIRQQSTEEAALEEASSGSEDARVEPPPPLIPPAGRELLALGPIPKRQSLLAKFRGETITETLWKMVVQTEETFHGDWESVGSWLRGADGDDRGLIDYVNGLQEFQNRNDQAAAKAFDRCGKCDPPLLNAMAYLVYLRSGSSGGMTVLLNVLKPVDSRDVETLTVEMLRRLGGRLDEEKRRDLEALPECHRKRCPVRQGMPGPLLEERETESDAPSEDHAKPSQPEAEDDSSGQPPGANVDESEEPNRDAPNPSAETG
ncbi:MAG: hypothetical protein ACYTG0_40885 [Planctomycetota bacterium]|jgi:hypothetical protein